MKFFQSEETTKLASLVAQVVKNPPGGLNPLGSIPWAGKIPWRREWQPTPVFLPGELHGQRNLVGYSLCRKEPDSTERLTHTVFKLPFHLHMCNIQQVNRIYLSTVAEKIIEKF